MNYPAAKRTEEENYFFGPLFQAALTLSGLVCHARVPHRIASPL
jgi:hypothetical protein